MDFVFFVMSQDPDAAATTVMQPAEIRHKKSKRSTSHGRAQSKEKKEAPEKTQKKKSTPKASGL